MADFALATGRLILRSWRDEDHTPLLAICRNPAVMAHLGPPLSAEDVRAAMDRMQASQETHGHCFWAIERQTDGEMLGFCGLKIGPEETPLDGQIEIGWRLRADTWGQGYAREAAQASLDWGWANLKDETIWAMTVAANRRSWGMMERLGMARQQDMDFDHPALAEDSPLRAHIVYWIARPDRVG